MTLPFSLTSERYDQSEFTGRFRKMMDIVDPRTLLKSSESILAAKNLLDMYSAGTISKTITDEQLWVARKLKESALHPDTGELIPQPFRMSGYVPYNGLVCVGAVMATSIHWMIFWHWLNQTQNAMVNYCNRNGSSKVTTTMLAQSYVVAVGSAVSVVFGLATAIKAYLPPATASILLRWVAMPASMIASCGNCYVMRRPELTSGILLKDKNGENEFGNSQAAASKAMREMLLSRAFLQPPVFGFPALVMSLPAVVAATKGKPKLAIAISTVSLLFGFQVGLPAAIAVFPQQGSIKCSSLEPQFQNLKDKSGNSITELYYNKGL